MILVVVDMRARRAFAMGSVSHLAAGVARSKHDTQHEIAIAKAAKLLVDQHGMDADIVAAQRADALLSKGNTAEGNRWVEIFQRIATS
jgi:hypothetical protein